MTQQQDKNLPDHPFWRFSLQLYGVAAAEKTLLFLQQRYGINVNVILYFCWVGANGQGRLSKGKVKTLLEIISNWHNRVVLPLRQLRRQVSSNAEVKAIVLKEEINAEHAEQLMLADAFWFIARSVKSPPQKVTDICRSIATYCATLEIKVDVPLQSAVVELLHLMYPMLSLSEIESITAKVILPQPKMAGSVGTQLCLAV